MYFFIEFSIPLIMKWTIEVQADGQGFPCLQRKFHTKFWSKLLHKDAEGQLRGREIIDSIKNSIENNKNPTDTIVGKEEISPFKQI